MAKSCTDIFNITVSVTERTACVTAKTSESSSLRITEATVSFANLRLCNSFSCDAAVAALVRVWVPCAAAGLELLLLHKKQRDKPSVPGTNKLCAGQPMQPATFLGSTSMSIINNDAHAVRRKSL